MGSIKFKKGDRVKVTSVEDYEIVKYHYNIGHEGTVMEDDTVIPFIMFDLPEANCSSKGTAVSQDQLEFI